MAQKSEKATPKKLRDARKKGQVAKAQDFPSAFTFLVSIFGTLAMATFFFEQVAGYMLWCFRQVGSQGGIEGKLAGACYQGILIILETSWPIMVIVCCVGVLISFLVNGPVFSFEPMKFDLKKLNPVEGIKQKFKLKVLVELLKSIAKVTGAAIIISLIMWHSLPEIIMAVTMPVIGGAIVAQNFIVKAAVQVGIFFLFVALFDLAFQKKNFAKEMMMEKFEVKQEMRDTEGDPLIKGKRKELFREIAYQEGPSSARRARAIITNPTHIAVALKYNPGDDVTPSILTMGQGPVAEQIIKIGLENKIPIMRNVDLARKLFAKGVISQYIPEDTYQAVAEILKWIEALEENPDVDIELFRPPGM